MKTPVQWAIDLSDAMEARDILNASLRNGRKLRDQRHDLRRAAELLYDLLTWFDREGLSEEYPDHFILIFDALSYLNTGLRSFVVDAKNLAKARDLLIDVLAFDSEGRSA